MWGAWVLRSIGAQKMEVGQGPRLANLATGLARDLDIEAPRLYLTSSGGPNALVVRASGSALAMATPMLELYTRTELEAVVAHCLVRLRDHRRMRRTEVSVALALPARSLRGFSARSPLGFSARSPLGPSASPAGGSLGPPGLEDDLATVAVTGYPPGLASAISKAEPARGRFAPLWFVSDSSQLSPERRVAELSNI